MKELFGEEDVNVTQNRELLTAPSARNWLSRQPSDVQEVYEVTVENWGTHPDVVIRAKDNPDNILYINDYRLKPYRTTNLHRAFYTDFSEQEKRIKEGVTMDSYKEVRRQLKPHKKSVFTIYADWIRSIIGKAYMKPDTDGKNKMIVTYDGKRVSGSLINMAVQKVAGMAWTNLAKKSILEQDPRFPKDYDMLTDPGNIVRNNERQIANAINWQMEHNQDAFIKYVTSISEEDI